MTKFKKMVVLSGGQDSTTCLMWALTHSKSEEVIAVSFDYGQKHVVELDKAAEICSFFGVQHKIFDIKGLLGGSALTDHSADINATHATKNDLPASFTAGRNALFLTVCASYADGLGCDEIITGVCETDYSGYPDCRNDFVKSQETTLRLALDNPKMKVTTPLMFLSKAETWKLAKDSGDKIGIDGVKFIVEKTITDYNGNDTLNYWGRGDLDNPASVLRKKGYDEALELGYV